MKLIAIETSTDICSIAYIQDGICENIIEEKIPRQHAEKLPLFYDELVTESKLKLSEIDAIAISIGPGSFTGLRIGLSYTKGLAYSHNLPIIPVSTMLSILHGSGKTSKNLMVMLFSHGNKYFIQKFGHAHGKYTLDEIQVFELNNINDLKELIDDNIIIQYGCDKLFKDSFTEDRVIKINPSSKWIGELAHLNYEEWIENEPYKLVPDYVSPFKIG